MAPLKRSAVWEFFVKEQEVIHCRECKKEVKAKAGNTTNLKRHLEASHPTSYKKMKSREASANKPKVETVGLISVANSSGFQPTIQELVTHYEKLPRNSKRAKDITHFIAKMICVDYQPFSIVEDKGFQDLINNLNPRYEIPTRQSLSKKIIPDMYKKKKAIVSDRIRTEKLHGLAITCDTWTSRATESYLSFTIHFVDSQLNLVNMCLAVYPFPESHTAVNLSNCIKNVLSEYVITEDLPIYLVTDNAKNMTNAADLLNVQSVSCFAHTLQLAINDGLKKFGGIEKIIAKGRAISGHFRRSTNANRLLAEAQSQLNLPVKKLKQDVSTRWNSTFYMMDRLVELKRAISLVFSEEDINVDQLSTYEWRVAEQLSIVLKPFELVTEMLSGERYPTISMVIPALMQLEDNLQSSDDLNDLRKQLLVNVRNRWPEIKKNPVYATATFIDPRYKLVGFSKSEREAVIHHVLKLCAAATSESDDDQSVLVDKNKFLSRESDTLKDRTPSVTMTCNNFWSSFVNKVEAEYSDAASSQKRSIQEEIDFYLKQNPIPLSKISKPLGWWKEHGNVFPNLMTVAKRFLPIPATSVPSERLFSKAGIMVSNRRCMLTSTLVEQLVFLNLNWDIN